MNNQNGFLSIESKNIFSILKKWLYTEQDIVFRELISNASDAIEKLSSLQEDEACLSPSKGTIRVTLDTEDNRLIISDNGIGMTADEVDRFINQIAFSGAAEFINQHSNEETRSIIGHFGVGFYSAFMLGDHVAIESKSCKEGTEPVRWDCNADMSYEMKQGSRTEHGTDVIIYLNLDSPYLKKPALIHDIIKKYFIFLKSEIYLNAPEFDNTLVNDPSPIWKKPQSEINTDDMHDFYKAYYDDVSDPLFWIKIESIDLGLKGILYFRDTKNGTEELDGKIRVYNRGVYVGENIKELIPKFVNLQSGIIECEDLPLVVSRSTIRDENEKDLTALIYECLSQEVTIAMNSMFENKRSDYEAYWPQLNAFVKYGIMQDRIFASVMTRKVVFEDLYGNHLTIAEYLDQIKASHENTVYYASDALEQAHYIEIFKKCGLNALLFDHVIDQPFMRRQELVHQKVGFIRIDSNIESLFEGTLSPDDTPYVDALTEKIRASLGERIANMQLKITNLEQESITSLIINDEKGRRMADMLEIYGFLKSTDTHLREKQAQSTYLVNLNNDTVKYILETEDETQSALVINQLFDLALMSQGTLSLEHMESFITRSETILSKIAQAG